jgi:pimeloyl-ACP methyl ester carboxylesterase
VGKNGDVILLHGFPETCDIFKPLMSIMASQGIRSLAYNQRGYSPGAAPSDMKEYHYDKLRDDIFAMADAVGFERFHLIGHDHGALLGWYAAGSSDGRGRLLSYTALSVPHPDAFSAGLIGKDADWRQQIAAQYFTMFPCRGAASFFFDSLGSCFDSENNFQKALWWYNGAFDAGVLAVPPLISANKMAAENPAMASIITGFEWQVSERQRPHKGRWQTNMTGSVNVPVLYIAGKADDTILGTHGFAKRTERYCFAGYTYLELNCGHDIPFNVKDREGQKVVKHILEHLLGRRIKTFAKQPLKRKASSPDQWSNECIVS